MEDSTSLAQNVSLVIDSLELNLRTRAKGYNETALADLFIMNSYWYIFKRARDSELGSVLGESWLKQRRQLVNQHVLSYGNEKRGPLLKYLNRNGLVMSTGGRGGARDLFKQRQEKMQITEMTLCEAHKFKEAFYLLHPNFYAVDCFPKYKFHYSLEILYRNFQYSSPLYNISFSYCYKFLLDFMFCEN
ncbi:hypothetical protein SUGI_0780360 [Cryptomeria japonica]|nr:hypothetical protein SUGI_0780360 [Cryptomeria japonica]